MSEENSSNRKAFVDIAKGYSEADYNGSTVFIKHFNIFDQSDIDSHAEKISKRYEKSGLKSEEQILKEAKQSGDWTDKQEQHLDQRKNFLKTLQNTVKNLLVPSQVKQMEDKIEEVKKEIQEISVQKQLLLQNSCEAYTQRKVSDLTISLSIFKDRNLSELLFSQDDFDDLERSEIYELVKIYNDAFELIDIEKIKVLALSGIFSNYFSTCESSSYEMFKKTPMDLTFFQLNLLNYGQMFKSIFKNIPNIPEEIKNNPNKLLEFAESGHEKAEKIREIQKKGGNKRGAQSFVGATKEDMEKMGYNTANFTSPDQLMKKAGKDSLSLVKGDF